MKRPALLLLLSVCVTSAVSGQNPSPTPGDFGPDPANIPAPTAATAPPASVPGLAFHFGARPVPPLGQKFGNVAAVAITPEGHLLVFNPNAPIQVVEYDATGSKVRRVFNPDIAVKPWDDGYMEAILLTEDGHVSEGSAEHVFIVRDDQVISPPSTADNPDGITRHSLITLAREDLDIPFVERPIGRTELYVADEVFLCDHGRRGHPGAFG